MNAQPELAFDGTLELYFYEQLEGARGQGARPLDRDVEAYVVNMLAAHVRRTNLAGRTSPALATQYLAARDRGATALREVGDRALYIAGVVPASLERGPVDVRYVSGIGEAAYGEIHARKPRLEVFARLADRFREVVDVLRQTLGGGGDDLLQLYERWRRTADPEDARRLLQAGVLLDPASADVLH